MAYTDATVTNQDWRNLENVNQNNMRILDESADKLLTAYYPLVPNITSANILFDISNQFGLTSSTATTATFNWVAGTKVTVRFPDQPINTYPNMSAYSNTIQSLIVTIINLPSTITLTSALDCYVVATLTINPIDAYRAVPLATIGAVTEAAPTTLDKIALFKLVLDGGVLVAQVDANCVHNYSLPNEFATRAETQDLIINNKIVSPDSLAGLYQNVLGTEDLDLVIKAGIYFQSGVVASANYPVALAGVLEVKRSPDVVPVIYQTFTCVESNTADSNRTYTRFRNTTGTWSAWISQINSKGGVIDGGNFSVESAAAQRKTELGVGGEMVLTSEVTDHQIGMRNQNVDSRIAMFRSALNNTTAFIQNKKINGVERRLTTYETQNLPDGNFAGAHSIIACNPAGNIIGVIESRIDSGTTQLVNVYTSGGTSVAVTKRVANQYLTQVNSNAATRRADPEAFALIGDVMGQGQTWQNVTGSRGLDVLYNSGTKPVYLNITVTNWTATSSVMLFRLLASSTTFIGLSILNPNGGVQQYGTLSAIIPPNTNYSLVAAADGLGVSNPSFIAEWSELR